MQRAKKKEIIASFARDKKDTGSPEVQIAILTKEITDLTNHLKIHIHDFHSKRGLLIKVGQRKSKLSYLAKNDVTKYREVVSKLGLRK